MGRQHDDLASGRDTRRSPRARVGHQQSCLWRRPLGPAVGGLFGVEACFVVAVLLFALQAAAILLSPVVRLRQQPSISA